jgi:two-component system LytT family response regulator
MVRAIIVEDEGRSADVLKSLVEKYCAGVQIVAVAQTVTNAIEAITEHKPSLVFLDVELPDGTGFKVLENTDPDLFEIIFVTAYEHYAIKAIKSCALDYLLKPVDIDELVTAVNKVNTEKEIAGSEKRKEVLLSNAHQKNTYKQKIALPTMEGLLFVLQEDIIFCEAQGNYTNFYLKGKEKILVSRLLNYFEEILDEEQFCRTHQSYLVNILHIEKYVKGRGGYLVMSDGSNVEVSARMKGDFLDRFIK